MTRTPRRPIRHSGLIRRRGSTSSSCTPPRPAHRPLCPLSPPPFTLGMDRWGVPRLVVGRMRTLMTLTQRGHRSPPQPPTSTQSARGRNSGRHLCWSVPSRASLAATLLLSGASAPWPRGLDQPTSQEVRTTVLLVLALCTGGATVGLAGHGRAPSWCTACLLGPWMAVSPHANVSDIADGARPASASPLWTPTAGERPCRRVVKRCQRGTPRPHCIGEPAAPYPLSGGSTREVLQLSLQRAQGGNLQAASTLPPMQGVPTPRAGL